MNRTRDIVRQIAVVIATIATVVVNILANTLPINGRNTGEISDQFGAYFVPAGYVFAIWGLIYLGLAAYTVYQMLPAQRENPRLRSIGWLYVLASAANIAWIFLWHYELFVWTLVAMAVLLLSLIAIYLRLGTGCRPAGVAETWLVRVPFSIYLGWITVATIANVTQTLWWAGWGRWGISEVVWLVIMLAVAVVLAAVMAIIRRDVAFLLVLVWAFIGIALKHAAVTQVSAAAWVAAGLVAILAVWSALTVRRHYRKLA